MVYAEFNGSSPLPKLCQILEVFSIYNPNTIDNKRDIFYHILVIYWIDIDVTRSDIQRLDTII